MKDYSLSNIKDRDSIVTTIDVNLKFPELLDRVTKKYHDDIEDFFLLSLNAKSSDDLLREIRSSKYPSNKRMSFLKLFRRCISTVLDTEKTKKISSVSSEDLIRNYGNTFKSIDIFQNQIKSFKSGERETLAVMLGEYDSRGTQGYELTTSFFNWFTKKFNGRFSIEGPTGAGKDIELSSIFPDFNGSYPCDFVIRDSKNKLLLAVGFARYDSTRGGSQSDDRTGGNANKVEKARKFCESTNKNFKIIFISDGPGLTHNDTWKESSILDGSWKGKVRVCTLKTAEYGLTDEWLSN